MITDTELFNRLTKTDLDLIRCYISNYAGGDGEDSGPLNAELDYILRFWSNNKERLADTIFRDNLILTKKVYIEKNADMLYKEIRNYIFSTSDDSNISKFLNAFYEISNEVITFTEDCGYGIHRLNELVWYENLAYNKFTGPSFTVPNPKDNRVIEVNEGCKISKILGKIASAYDLPYFEDFRLAHSLALNQKYLEGELCISIHPLDYMTMSDNDCDWDSCMSWQQPGDYRQGTVEMMNSDCVIVAYLKAKEDMDICWNSGMFWNNKKWRELFVVSKDIIMGIKPYPYYNDELESITAKWIKELATKTGLGVYTENACKFDNFKENVLGELNTKAYIEFKTNRMYNDINVGHFGYPGLTMREKDHWSFHLSGPSECMTCGEDYSFDSDFDEWQLSCYQCSGEVKCCECGVFIRADDAHYLDGYAYCDCCYDDNSADCINCGERVHNENAEIVYVRMFDDESPDDIVYHHCKEFCLDCFSKGRKEPLPDFGIISVIDSPKEYFWLNSMYVVDAKNLSPNGWCLFGYIDAERDEYLAQMQEKNLF